MTYSDYRSVGQPHHPYTVPQQGTMQRTGYEPQGLQIVRVCVGEIFF